MDKPRLLIASNNPGKLEEFRRLLADSGCQIVSPQDLGIQLSADETGGSYAENATIKALEGAKLSGLLTIADDSGLEIDTLAGAPGHLSARYLGEEAGYPERFAAILEALEGLPASQRTARFRCVIAVALPDKEEVRLVEATCEGTIAQEPLGEKGFGYDPIFYLPELGKTMAQVASREKDKLSHRGRAARAALPIIKELAHASR
ncbi:MAG TPA: RdgB/HAM1 family non-canonical purine NTP pyrophosphatase [Dehalococcoidia bacterium]|nr:RdgB/HAM1 family non-canonical purine NTP pyrophosphatase [Dehalococcoidia bacterium]